MLKSNILYYNVVGQNMTLSITGMDAFSGNCSAFIVLNNSGLFVHPAYDNNPPNHMFLCLKGSQFCRLNQISVSNPLWLLSDKIEPYTNEYSTAELTSTTSFFETIDNSITSQGLESTISFFTIPQFTKNISIPQVNNNEQQPNEQQQQQKRNIGIGVGVGVALSVFSIALIILTVCIVKKR